MGGGIQIVGQGCNGVDDGDGDCLVQFEGCDVGWVGEVFSCYDVVGVGYGGSQSQQLIDIEFVIEGRGIKSQYFYVDSCQCYSFLDGGGDFFVKDYSG